jgi:hypothetical protein
MSIDHDIPELDRRGLRNFALTMAAVIVVLFGLFLPWLIERPWPRWPWILAAVFALPGLIAPAALRPIYRGWMKFGLALNRITTPIIMSLMFYLVITPTGLLRRLFGGDPMKRKLERTESGSYRVPSKAAPPERMERPF